MINTLLEMIMLNQRSCIKKLLTNKILILTTVLALVSLSSAQTNQTNQKNDSPKGSGITKAIDIRQYDKEIEIATKVFNEAPRKKESKRKLAATYAARGFALINAAQYAAGLGDLRRCLKLNPKNKEAKEMRDQILGIYKSLQRTPPAESKEPSPITFNQD